MTKLKAGLVAAAGALLLAAPAFGIGGASRLEQLRVAGQASGAGKTAALTAAVRHKRARSCNAGSNRKGTRQSPAAVNAWAVACEFPPRSQTLPSTALQNAVATAAILGG